MTNSGAFEIPGLPFDSDGGFKFYQRMSKLNYWSVASSIKKKDTKQEQKLVQLSHGLSILLVLRRSLLPMKKGLDKSLMKHIFIQTTHADHSCAIMLGTLKQ